ncbi:YacL family protein [Serratia microhaemolytica]|uniref:YacL family protein n=1 Tax=Serratia microhaemolytica TaxID=2675110 RepID=UPI000FDD120B|nr:YacL family protein [Serratia microhaemolytica]
MDYEFLRDIDGQVLARFSMGHEVIGYWLNEEVKGDLRLLDTIEANIGRLSGNQQWQWEGHEYSLLLDREEVMIRANQLAFSSEELAEGMSYYDEESLSFCGLEDFQLVLRVYRRFILDGMSNGD